MIQKTILLLTIGSFLVILIYFIVVLWKKYRKPRVVRKKSYTQYECLEEKREYLKNFGTKQNKLSRFVYILAFAIPLIMLIWFNAETYSMKFLDKEAIQSRVRDAFLLSGVTLIAALMAAKVVISVLKENYNGYKPIILSLSKTDWQTFLTLQKKLMFFRNSLPYYIFSGNTISVYFGWKVKTFDLSEIQSFKNYGLVKRYRSGSWYESKIQLRDNQKIRFAMKEEEIHRYLVSRLSRYSIGE